MKISKKRLKKIIKEEYARTRRQEVREQLIAEGWLDKLKAKSWGAGKGIEKKISQIMKKKGSDLPTGMSQDEYSQGMKELYFVAHARGNMAKRLEAMAQEMEKDTADMGFGEGTAKEELEEISVLLRKAAEEIKNVKDIMNARKDEFEF